MPDVTMTSSLAICLCLSCLPHVFGFVPCNNASLRGYCYEGWHCCDNGWCCSDDFVCGDNRCIYLKGLYVPVGIVVLSFCGAVFICLHQMRKKKKIHLTTRLSNVSKPKLKDPEDVYSDQFSKTSTQD